MKAKVNRVKSRVKNTVKSPWPMLMLRPQKGTINVKELFPSVVAHSVNKQTLITGIPRKISKLTANIYGTRNKEMTVLQDAKMS